MDQVSTASDSENADLSEVRLQGSRDAIIAVDAQQRVVLWNAAAGTMFGYSPAEVQGKALGLVLCGPKSTDHFPAASRQSRFMTDRKRFRGRRKNGSAFPAEMALEQLTIDGRQVGVGVVRDLTQQAPLEEFVFERQKAETIAHVGAAVAHDLANLLTVIGALAEVSLPDNNNENSSPHTTDLRELKEYVDHATALVRQLVTFSATQANNPDRLDVVTAIRKMGGLLRAVVGSNLKLELSAASDPIFVKLRNDQLSQILINLVANARDASAGGGRVSISVQQSRRGRLSPRFMHLCVTDSGSGMSSETQQRAFEPYFSTKEQDGGTGLGLFSVSRIATELGGTVHIESQPGVGTAISVLLPCD